MTKFWEILKYFLGFKTALGTYKVGLSDVGLSDPGLSDVKSGTCNVPKLYATTCYYMKTIKFT